MDTTLFLADFSAIDTEKLQALKERAGHTKIFIARGTVKGVSFNTSLSQKTIDAIREVFDFDFIEYEFLKKSYDSFTNRYVVDSNDILINALIDDLNLKGRTDTEFLRFEVADDKQTLINLKSSHKLLMERTEALSEQVSDLKILLSVILDSFPEEKKNEIAHTYTEAKKKVSETLNVSQNFLSFVSSKKKTSISNALKDFGTEKKLDSFYESSIQVLEKLTHFNANTFREYVETEKTPAEIVSDRNVINAVVIAFGQSLK